MRRIIFRTSPEKPTPGRRHQPVGSVPEQSSRPGHAVGAGAGRGTGSGGAGRHQQPERCATLTNQSKARRQELVFPDFLFSLLSLKSVFICVHPWLKTAFAYADF